MKKYIYLVVAAALLLSGCKSWLDINKSPNNAEKEMITSDYLLTACQYDMINNLVNSSNAMMLSQHLTKSGEYSGNYTYLNGLIMAQNQDSWWATYYETISNLNVVYEKSIESESDIYRGISLTLIAHNYQRLVDIFGDVPYTQACKPIEFAQPEYDKAEDIYKDLLVKMDEAIVALEKAATSTITDPILKKADIICFGDAKMWVKLAYSMKLRLLMRLSSVQDVSALVSAIADKCLPIEANIVANPGFYAETGKMNIFYENYGWDKQGAENTNHRQYMPTTALVDMLRVNHDPRMRALIDPRQTIKDHSSALYSKYGLGDEPYVGIPYGQASPPGRYYTSWTGTGILAGGADKAKGRLLGTTFFTGAEVGFLLAEAALRGMIPGGDTKAKEYYEASVTSAMKRHEVAMQAPTKDYGVPNMLDPIVGTAEQAAKKYLAQENDYVNWDKMGNVDRKLEAIFAQKWVHFFGINPLEAWFEYRRVDLPRLLQASNQGQKNKIICRLPYPQTERNYNEPNVSKQPDIDVYESLVFWDQNNPLVEKAELYL